MKKQILIGLGAGLTLVICLASIKYFQISAAIAEASTRVQPPEAVTSIRAVQEQWQFTRSAVGSIQAVQGATLSIEELGTVSEINFSSGSDVEKGDLLIALDSSVEQAQLKSAEAQLELNRIELKRQETLRQRNANAQADLDTARASFTTAKAEVDRIRAEIARKRIVAPFSGRTGIRLVDLGQTISAGTPVVSLQSFNPVYVNFSLAQRELRAVEPGAPLEVTADAFPDQVFTGTITALGAEISTETRTISVQGTLPNPELKLRPGMFVQVTVKYPEVETVIVVPASSISYAPYGNTIYVIEPASDPDTPRGVRAQLVKVGRRRGDQIAVLSGLKPGDEVVTSGTFKLRPGIQVIVNNSVVPQNDPSPVPADT